MSEMAQDPTRAGSEPPDWAGEVMQLSQSEITALATKAARGAGLSWGEAEEAVCRPLRCYCGLWTRNQRPARCARESG